MKFKRVESENMAEAETKVQRLPFDIPIEIESFFSFFFLDKETMKKICTKKWKKLKKLRDYFWQLIDWVIPEWCTLHFLFG